MILTTESKGLGNAVRGFSCFFLPEGVGCRACCCYPGSFRASVADRSVAGLILQLAGGLLEKGNFSDLETGSAVNADSVTFRNQKCIYKINSYNNSYDNFNILNKQLTLCIIYQRIR
jgi:hypothetical protein